MNMTISPKTTMIATATYCFLSLCIMLGSALWVVTSLEEQNAIEAAKLMMPDPVSAVSKPLVKEEYQAIAKDLDRQFKGFNIVADNNGLRISGNNVSDYPGFITALQTPMVTTNYRWTIQEACLGPSCAGDPLNITLTAQKMEIKND